MESKSITIERTFDCARERVFKAWVTPESLKYWFHADETWTTPYVEIDARSGGTFKIGFKDPEGKHSFDFGGTYDEIIEPEKIAFTIGDGRKVLVTFEDEDGKTKQTLVFEMETINSDDQQRHGWTLMVNHLEEFLKGEK